MNKLIRFYNQNRLQFWIIVLMIAGIIILLQVLNGFVKEENKRKASQNAQNSTVAESRTEKVKNQKASTPVLEGSKLSNEQKNNNINIIESFFNYCKNGEIENAYNLLGTNCKNIYYKTVQEFNENYVQKNIFSNMSYDYELWKSSRFNIYRIKIYEDMLSTGKVVNSFKEDFFTIVSENNQTKLNINSFINRVNVNKKLTIDNVTINVNYLDLYQDSYVYNITVSNKSINNVILDTRKNTKTTYLENSYGIHTEALLYENFEKELTYKPQEEKTLNIKFSLSYREDLNIKALVFSDVVLDSNNIEKTQEFRISV